MLNKIVESCNFLLNNFPQAKDCKDYLDGRLKQESQDSFQFGYFPDLSNIKVLTNLIGDDTLKDIKLLYSNSLEDSFGPRQVNFSYFDNYPLIMPFKNTYGKIVALVGRTLLSESERQLRKIPKYKNTRESKDFKKGNLLFGLFENKQHIIDQNCVYIVEGQFDVIKAFEKGFRNIVALGNSNMTAYQLSVISRYTNNIFLLLDNDEAGEKGRKRIIDKFGSLANIRNFYLPDGFKDVDEYLSQHSYESLSFVVKD